MYYQACLEACTTERSEGNPLPVTPTSNDASGYVGQVITATSSTKTPNVQDAWHDFTGNSVTLTPGVWQLFGNIAFDNPGTSPGYRLYWGAWCTTAGNNTTTLPALLTPSAGLNNIQIDMGTQSFPKLFMTMSNIIHRVSSDTTVYLNASSNQANGSNARVTCILTAVRIA